MQRRFNLKTLYLKSMSFWHRISSLVQYCATFNQVCNKAVFRESITIRAITMNWKPTKMSVFWGGSVGRRYYKLWCHYWRQSLHKDSSQFLLGIEAHDTPLQECIYMYIEMRLNYIMMTSSNGNIFRITGPLCGEFTGPGEFPAQRPVTRNFDVFFDLRLNKWLSKQSWGWWFETLSWSLWRHCNVFIHIKLIYSLP